MTLGKFESAGRLGRPGSIGRWWRVANGIGVLAISVWILASYTTYVRFEPPSLLGAVLIFLGIAAALLNFSSTSNVGLTRNGAAAVFLRAVIFDFFQHGHIWARRVA